MIHLPTKSVATGSSARRSRRSSVASANPGWISQIRRRNGRRFPSAEKRWRSDRGARPSTGRPGRPPAPPAPPASGGAALPPWLYCFAIARPSYVRAGGGDGMKKGRSEERPLRESKSE